MTSAGDEPRPGGHGRAEFAAFYRSTSARTFASALRAAAGDPEAAHESTQEAYVVMWERWHERCSRSVKDNGRYVVGIAVRKVADWHRQRIRLVALTEDEDASGEDIGFTDVLDQMSVLRAVRELIASQPNRRREVGVLFFLEDFSYKEIAETLAITESTVRTHIERLRLLLKPLLDADGQFGQGGERP